MPLTYFPTVATTRYNCRSQLVQLAERVREGLPYHIVRLLDLWISSLREIVSQFPAERNNGSLLGFLDIGDDLFEAFES